MQEQPHKIKHCKIYDKVLTQTITSFLHRTTTSISLCSAADSRTELVSFFSLICFHLQLTNISVGSLWKWNFWCQNGADIYIFPCIRKVNIHLYYIDPSNLSQSNYSNRNIFLQAHAMCQRVVISTVTGLMVSFRRFSLSSNGWQEDCKFTSGRIQDA